MHPVSKAVYHMTDIPGHVIIHNSQMDAFESCGKTLELRRLCNTAVPKAKNEPPCSTCSSPHLMGSGTSQGEVTDFVAGMLVQDDNESRYNFGIYK